MAYEHPAGSSESMSRIEELLWKGTYGPEQAASLLDMDVQRIYAAACRGDLKARVVGNDMVSVERSDLIDWLRHRE